MKYRNVGKSNITVSEIALGCWGFTGDQMWGPGVASVITGARHPKQIQQMAEAPTVELSPSIPKALNEVTQPVKEKLGQNPDMWLPDEESRYR